MGKTALTIGTKAMHLSALVAPIFGEDLISVVQLTTKGNKVVFTKNNCSLHGPSDTEDQGSIIGVKGSDNLYRLRKSLAKPKKHGVMNAKL